LSYTYEQLENHFAFPEKWKIIIADDEKDIHLITELIFKNYSFSGKKIQFLNAYSGEETKQLIIENPDTALILLDVVMETDDAGLETVRYIRKNLNNSLTQIVLRTGQPGQAPEQKVIIEYEINDYKSKSELTAEKLFTTVTSALRAYKLAYSYDRVNSDLHKEIIQRKLTEAALRESENRYRTMMNMANDAIFIADAETGMLVDANIKAIKLFGYTQKKIKKMHYSELYLTDQSEEHNRFFHDYKNYATGTMEAVIVNHKGRHIQVEVSAGIIHVAGRKLLQSIFRDIEDRKKAETALKESEAKWRSLVKNAPERITTMDCDGTILFINKPLNENPPEKLIGTSLYNHLPKGEKTTIKNIVSSVFKTGEPQKYESNRLDPDGREIWYDNSVAPISSDGNIVAVILLSMNITEQKQSERQRQEHLWYLENIEKIDHTIRQTNNLEMMTRNVIEIVFSIFNCDRAALVFPCDPNTETMSVIAEIARPEYPKIAPDEKAVNISVTDQSKDILETILNSEAPIIFDPLTGRKNESYFNNVKFKSAMTISIHPRLGKPWMLFLYQCSRERIWTQDEKSLFRDIGNRISDALSNMLFYQDLSDSEVRFRLLIETMNDGLAAQDENGTINYVNEKFCQMCQLPRNLLIGRSTVEFIDDNSKQIMTDYYKETIDKNNFNDNNPFEIAIPHKDGSKTYALVSPKSIMDTKENRIGDFAVFTDITARKQAEEVLNIYKHIVSSSSDQMCFVNNNYEFMAVNDTFLNAFNKSRKEITGLKLEDMFDENEFYLKIKKVFDYCMTAKEISFERWYDFPGTGQKYSAFTLYPYIGDDGSVTGVVLNLRDITEKIQFEKAMVDTGEEERRKIGIELHDGLSHNLLGIAIKARLLAENLNNTSKSFSSEAAEIEKYINQTIKETRSLARGLFPVNLEEGDIFALLEGIKVDLAKKHKISCIIGIDKTITISDIMIYTQLYYIIQEAVNNTVKHSNAKTVKIFLETEENYVNLSIIDDGIGILEKNKTRESMGINIMKYRARMIGGILNIRKGEKKGTEVNCRFKLQQSSPSKINI